MKSKNRSSSNDGLYWHRGKWYGGFVDAHGIWRQRALSRDRETARMILRDLKSRSDLERHGVTHVTAQTIRIAEVVDCYLSELPNRTSPSRVKQICRFVHEVLDVLRVERICDLTVESIIKARRVIQGRVRTKISEAHGKRAHLSNRTVNMKVESILACLRWATECGKLRSNPVPKIEPLPERGEHQRRRRLRMQPDDLLRIVRAAREDDERTGSARVPQSHLLEFIAETGCRFGEAAFGVRWCDLYLAGDQGWVRLRAEVTKTKQERVSPITTGLMASLRSLRTRHAKVVGRLPGDESNVFLTPNGKPWTLSNRHNAIRRLNRWIEEAGLQKSVGGRTIDWHAFRHTFATDGLAAGVDLATMQALLGHSTPSQTIRYADLERVPKADGLSKILAHRAANVPVENHRSEDIVSK